jgi:exodeoxyribonuclease-3
MNVRSQWSVATWNVDSLRARLAGLLGWLDGRKIDVVCVQETRVRTTAFPRAELESRGYHVAMAGDGGYAGVATLSRAPIDDSFVGLDAFTEAKAPGRRLLCRIGELWIDNVYVPTRNAIGKREFLDVLAEDRRARALEIHPGVLAGDFNICFDARDYAAPSMITDPELHPNRPEDLALRRATAGLVDCFRAREDRGGHFTWFPRTSWALKRNWGMRLDYIFATPALARGLVDARHDRELREGPSPSDHAPVIATFDGS